MIRMPFDPNALSGPPKVAFDNWTKLATRVQQQLNDDVAGGKKAKFRGAVWGMLKKWLLEHVYHGKCAYCENNIHASFVGDAEHYRPKGGISDDPAHPGYYWLAYDWKNLIPSCEKCNAGAGKGAKFPIKGTRARQPTDAASFDELNKLEMPLLLHPYDGRDPSNHLVFTPDGAVVGCDEVGETTISILGLNRERLMDLRRDYIKYAINSFAVDVGPAMRDPATLPGKIQEIKASLASHKVPFSAAIKQSIEVVCAGFGTGNRRV